MAKRKIALLGGSGLEKFNISLKSNSLNPNTPYGKCSSSILHSQNDYFEIFYVSRHGFKHQYAPQEVNNRAHIWAFKDIGCDFILATSACGSLREDIKPGDLIFPNQLIDFTKNRKSTFFESFADGMQHTSFADPFDRSIVNELKQLADNLNIKSHTNKTVLTIEGPRFSSRAESHLFRLWGADIINMSTAPEVALANEINIPYALIAMSTDYDSWRDEGEAVSQDAVFKIFKQNAQNVTHLIEAFIER